jgi:arylsulfatase A-like enzyme/tetratricopeptide (TPR) repeat protein
MNVVEQTTRTVPAARRCGRPAPGLGRLLGRLAVLAPGLMLGACAGGERVAGSGAGNPVILVSIDTLRSDRLPDYGHAAVRTPAISALAADGVLYERAYSHVPLTLPSHITMFTGEFPGASGVRDNLGYRFDASRHPYLPKLLQAAGYRTGAAVSTYVLRAETGLADGFDFYESAVDLRMSESLGRSQRPCRETLAASLPWLAEVATAKQPFFFFFHAYEPHSPWDPPAEIRARAAHPYEGEIEVADACVAGLVAELRRHGLYERSTIILTSDHGEGLGDHGELEHGILLYREALQVPLIVKLPDGRRAGTRVATPAQLVDLLPTVAELVGLELPASVVGQSLLQLDPAQVRPIFAESFYPRLHLGWSELTSLIADRHHLIDGPDPELYDLVADPGERNNLRATERRTFAALRDAAEPFRIPLSLPTERDPEAAAKLASLGYLGGGGVSAADEVLPDPKSKVHTLEAYSRAVQALTAQDYPHAAELFRELARENPRMVDAWENLGRSLHRLGRHQEALEAYERAMRESGGVAHVALGTATLLLDLGRYAEARQHAELAVESSEAAARSLLAQVALAEKDFDVAEREARASLAARGSRIGPLVVLAQVLRDRGDLSGALAESARALAEVERMSGDDRKFPGLWYVHGDVLARLGRSAEAAVAFLREIELYPADPRPYTRLAVLYAANGQGADAVNTLQRLVETNPGLPLAWAEAIKTLRVLGDEAGAARLLAFARQRMPNEPALAAL